MNNKENQNVLRHLYYIYFTEYLLFSKQYKKILEEGLLDVDLADGYLYELCCFVNQIDDNNIYPIFIIERLKEFVSLLENYIKDESGKEIIRWMMDVIEKNDWMDATEVYNREYLSRYATVASSKDYDIVSIRRLIVDIQKDFQYLNMIIMNHKELESCIEEDFPFFLNKLLLDFPEITECKKMRDKVIRILKERNFENKEKYIHFLSDKTDYRVKSGFDLVKVENFYSLTILDKILASKNIQDELNRLQIGYVYQDSFLLAIYTFVDEASTNKQIMKREHDNLKELLFYMRIHLDDTNLYNRRAVIEIINMGLEVLNVLSPSEDISGYVREYMRRIGNGYCYLFLNSFKREEVHEHIDFLIAFTPQVFDYLLGKIEKESFITRGPIYDSEIDTNYMDKDIIMVIEYLFKNYPRMFFDDTIYNRGLTLLKNVHSLKSGNVKRRIYKIRRDN